jgi:hypothetical protein
VFCSLADTAADRRVTRESPLPVIIRLSLSNPDATEIQVPDRELYRTFLRDLHPFILLRGNADFEAINDLLQQRLPPGELADANAHNRLAWGHIMRGDGEPELHIGAKVYHPSDLLALFLNRLHSRPDARRKAEFNRLPRFYQQYAEFGFAIDVGRAANAQAAIIRRALAENILDLTDDR